MVSFYFPAELAPNVPFFAANIWCPFLSLSFGASFWRQCLAPGFGVEIYRQAMFSPN